MLILSGRYLGFLPDHYAESFEKKGLMQAIAPQRFHYNCNFVSLLRRSPQPSRAALLFQSCLEAAHHVTSRARDINKSEAMSDRPHPVGTEIDPESWLL